MHILHVCRLFKPHVGGVETHVWQVATVQQAQGNRVTIITTQHDTTVPLEESVDGLTILRLPFQYSLRKLQTWQWIWQHAAVFLSADVIQVHDIFWWLIPIYLQNRTKIITTFHGWETTWPIPLSARMQRRLFSYLSMAVVHVGAWIQEFYGDTPDKVLYGGVAPEYLAIPERKKINPKKNIHFVFLGRLEADTGVPLYIQFFTSLRNLGFTLQVTWVGDGGMREQCEAVGEVTGWQDTVVQWLRVSDIVCASSYLSILQAQAAGRLVISLYANELKSAYLKSYKGSQYCIVSASAETAAIELQNVLLKPEELRQMQTGAKAFANKQTWNQVAAVYADLIYRITGERIV